MITKSDIKLKDVCNIIMGQSPESSSYNQQGIGIPFFQGCSDFGEIHPSIRTYCSNPKKKANVDDILISVRAPIGTMNIADRESCIGRGIAAITPLETADKDFVYYLLQFNKGYLQSQGTGSTFKAIGKTALENMPVPNIPLKRQKVIGTEFRLIDRVLANQRRQLTLLDDSVKSRFIEMFGDTNNSMEWPIANVESIAKVKVGLVIKPTRFYSSSPTRYKAIRGLNISPFCINDTNWVYFTEDGAKSNKKTEVKENDVVVVRSGAPGTAAVVTKGYAGSNAIDVLIVEPDLTQIDPTYLCAYTNFPHGLKQISKGSGGAAQKHFNVEKYKNLTIFIPPLEKQKLFSIEKKEIDKSKFICLINA